MNLFAWIDSRGLRYADAGAQAAWYWLQIKRSMLIRICLVFWVGLDLVRSVCLTGRANWLQLFIFPVILLGTIADERRLNRLSIDVQNAFLLARREGPSRRMFRSVILTLASVCMLSVAMLPYPAVNALSTLFFIGYVYVSDALIPMGKRHQSKTKNAFRSQHRKVNGSV